MIACKGEPVESLTVRSLVRDGMSVEDTDWFFCSQPDCDVVYFSEKGTTIPKEDLTVRVGVKEREAPHLVCYCFNHSEESIRKEIEETGRSTVLQSITEKVKAGECSCETMNPKGTCCLGYVSKVVRGADRAVDDSAHDCCWRKPVQNDARTGKAVWAVAASVVTAIGASACCWLPLLFLAFGISAAGVSAAFENVRPVLLGLTAVLLGFGFYLTYVRGSRCSTKVCKPNRMQRFSRAMLWIATVLVVALAFFPNYLGFFSGSSGESVQSPSTVTLNVEGMTCEGCSLNVRSALEGVPGVKRASVNYAEGKATIEFEPGSVPSTDRLIEALEKVGYKANTTDRSKLHDLSGDAREIRHAFNDEKGKVRLVLLVSPG